MVVSSAPLPCPLSNTSRSVIEWRANNSNANLS